MRLHIWLGEMLDNILIDWLLANGTSDPTDHCECLYVTFFGWLEVVFHLFV